jgi:hypothetical protein
MATSATRDTGIGIVGLGRLGAPDPRRTTTGNRWIGLDEAWAKRLGVPKDAGRYRIRANELLRRLRAVASPPGATDGVLVEVLTLRPGVQAGAAPIPRRKAV